MGERGHGAGGLRRRPWRLRALWLGLAACAVPDRFADRAVDYTRSLELAENRGLLLNILRAASDRPLYFTSFSAVRGSMSVSLGASAAADLGYEVGDATSLGVVLAPSVALANSPSFDLAVLDSHAFARGLLTPIDNNVLDVFYQQDRDVQQLLDLFVHRIDVVLRDPEAPGPADVLYHARFWNDLLFRAAPSGDPAVHDQGRTLFRCARSVLARAGLELRQGEATRPVNLVLPASQLGDAEAIASALKAGLRLRPLAAPTAGVELLRLESDAHFVFPGEPAATALPASAREMAERDPGGLSRYQANALRLTLRVGPPSGPTSAALTAVVIGGREVPIALEPSCEPLAAEVFAAAGAGGSDLVVEFVLYVRSTESVLRYVGLRTCACYGPPLCDAPAVVPAEPPVDEILTLERKPIGDALADVELEGRRYAVARGDRSSARTMAQLKQLIALHNRAEEAPATAAVTVVGTGSAAGRP